MTNDLFSSKHLRSSAIKTLGKDLVEKFKGELLRIGKGCKDICCLSKCFQKNAFVEKTCNNQVNKISHIVAINLPLYLSPSSYSVSSLTNQKHAGIELTQSRIHKLLITIVNLATSTA